MINPGKPVAYKDVMLDWAVTEASSPRWRDHYRGAISTPLFWSKLQDKHLDVDRLDDAEKAQLVRAVEHVRGPILREYGVMFTWKFRRALVPLADLRSFLVMSRWFSGSTLGDMDARWRTPQSDRERSLAIVIQQMMQAGGLRGTPIAIRSHATATPRLIEGYGRCGVAMRTGVRSLRVYIGEP